MRWLGAALLALALAGCTADAPRIATPATSAPAGPTCPAGGPAGRPAPGPDALPDLTLPCLAGDGTVALRSLAGTPTVLNLWASWCAPCKEELPALAALHSEAAGRLRILGVASSDRPAAAAAYAADARLPFPSLADQDGQLLRGLGRRGLPVTVLVGADGRVRAVYQGPPLTGAALRALVREKLGVDV
ncbi:MAG TPA: TlpA disulfide reductase family protein [Mycobacteriales bacterium]